MLYSYRAALKGAAYFFRPRISRINANKPHFHLIPKTKTTFIPTNFSKVQNFGKVEKKNEKRLPIYEQP